MSLRLNLFTQTQNVSMPRTPAFRAGGLETFSYESQPIRDNFSTNPIYTGITTKSEIEALAKSNPRIMTILKEHNLPLRVNMQALEDMMPAQGHLTQTRVIAAKIYSALPADMKGEINLSDLQQAAMLHDFGKVLIPKEILNKDGALTQSEKEIMNLHSELGYELLKQKGISENVLRLIKYHHQTPDGRGYPAIDGDYQDGVDLQVLAAADKYSALTEDRAYHKAYSKEEAIAILEEDLQKGAISDTVFNALKKAA